MNTDLNAGEIYLTKMRETFNISVRHISAHYFQGMVTTTEHTHEVD